MFHSLKTLTAAKFEEDATQSSEKAGERPCICPVCRKGLTNNVKAFGTSPVKPQLYHSHAHTALAQS